MKYKENARTLTYRSVPNLAQSQTVEKHVESTADGGAGAGNKCLSDPARGSDGTGGTGRLQRAPTYSAFATIYDKAMGEAVLPSVLDAFSESRNRFAISTDSIADIGCGTGRFLKYLTRFNGKLTGIDMSRAMLKLAERRLAGADVRLARMDMRELVLPQRVETVTATFDTLNYLLSSTDLSKTFRRFATALAPGGTLLFDFIPRGANKGATGGTQHVELGPVRSEWRIRIDPEGRGSAVAIIMHRDDDKVLPLVEVHRQRWHDVGEVKRLLTASGFELLDCRPAEPGGDGNWLHVVARKTGQTGAPL